MDNFSSQVEELTAKLDALEKRQALQMRQMEISLLQAEANLQLQIRSLGGVTKKTMAIPEEIKPFVRNTFWKKTVFDKSGKIKDPFDRLFFKGNGRVRAPFHRVIFKKSGSPRPHFFRALKSRDSKTS